MRLMPSRYVGDMCSRPSTSLPLLIRCRVAASVLSSTAMVVVSSDTLEVAAARLAAILAGQQLRSEERDQLALVGPAERAAQRLMFDHRVPARYRPRPARG